MTAPPLVSVLLPIRDAAATLPACLASLRRQTLAEWECVAVDDGSRDESPALARAAAAADGRFRAIAGPRAGLVAALEAGIDRCRGRIVARMDADDCMHRRRLELQARALLAQPELAAVGCHVRLFPRAGLMDGMRAYERWLAGIDSPRRVREEAFVECPVAHPSLAIRREVLAAARYRDEGWPEDYDLVLRLLADGREIGMVPRRLLLWRHGPGRLSRSDARYAPERFTACKAAFLSGGFLAGGPRYVLWGYGATGRALAKALRRHGKTPAAIVELHPGRVGNTIQGAPVIPVEALCHPSPHPLVVSVAGAEARGRIRAELARKGFRELRDYVCAA